MASASAWNTNPATAAAVPAHHSGLRISVSTMTLLTPCSGGNVHRRALTHDNADREEHRREQREEHRQTMAYQSVLNSFRAMATTPHKNSTFGDGHAYVDVVLTRDKWAYTSA